MDVSEFVVAALLLELTPGPGSQFAPYCVFRALPWFATINL